MSASSSQPAGSLRSAPKSFGSRCLGNNFHEEAFGEFNMNDPWAEGLWEVLAQQRGKAKMFYGRQKMQMDKSCFEVHSHFQQAQMQYSMPLAHATRISLQRDAYVDFVDGNPGCMGNPYVWDRVTRLFNRK
mmetsp:Transcript_12567/g.38413  ORF Transcript_12567/g.38413 Transcript_12567/m.38413 type:complete len:131 (-) Transcript_12567:1301-1693(-)